MKKAKAKKPTIYVNIKGQRAKIRERIQKLNRRKESFSVSKTSRTTVIETETVKYYYCESKFPVKLFPLMSELKRMIIANADKVADCKYSNNPFDIQYYCFSNPLKDIQADAGTIHEIGECNEVDITKAYYRSAFNLGFISEEFYNKCIKLKKSHRLRLMGSIATIKIIKHYEGGRMVGVPEIKKNELLREAWFKLSSYVDDAMLTMREFLKDAFLMYWVDGIYFKDFQLPEAEAAYIKQQGFETGIDFIIHELKRQFNFEAEYTRIPKLEVISKGTHVEVKCYKPDGKVKYFYPRTKSIKCYGLVNVKNF